MGMCASRAGDSEAAILSCAKPKLAAVCTREVFDISFDVSFSALLKPRIIKGIEADTKNNVYPQAWQMSRGLNKADKGGNSRPPQAKEGEVSREGLPKVIKVITYSCQEVFKKMTFIVHGTSSFLFHSVFA